VVQISISSIPLSPLLRGVLIFSSPLGFCWVLVLFGFSSWFGVFSLRQLTKLEGLVIEFQSLALSYPLFFRRGRSEPSFEIPFLGAFISLL